MSDFASFAREQLSRPEIARAYYRQAPFYQIANQLLLLRKKRGLSQQELAQRAETTQAVVSRLENVSVRCSLETVVRLAEALDAIVEIQLTPKEELELRQTAEAGKPDCEDEIIAPDDSMKGIVFFGAGRKAVCQNVINYQIDPLTMKVVPAKKALRRKITEFA